LKVDASTPIAWIEVSYKGMMSEGTVLEAGDLITSAEINFADPDATYLDYSYLYIPGLRVAGKTEIDGIAVYPNPFREELTVEFILPEDSWVEMKIYDVSERVITFQDKSWMEKGTHRQPVVLPGAAPGVYFLELARQATGGEVVTRTEKIIKY